MLNVLVLAITMIVSGVKFDIRGPQPSDALLRDTAEWVAESCGGKELVRKVVLDCFYLNGDLICETDIICKLPRNGDIK